MRVKQFLVLPKLPDRILKLQELAHNLWYSWNWELVRLFIRLDADTWERCHQNPVAMLSQIPQERLRQATEDESFIAHLDRVYNDYQQYLRSKKWFENNYPHLFDSTVAYFSMEYGLDTGLPVYSGGLGVLSGDTLKAGSDLGIPMVAVGLMYRYGYFRQTLSSDGWQQERYEENDWYQMPVEIVKDESGVPIRVQVEMDGAPVLIQIWKVNVGVVPLYLLDTNIPENSSKFREISSVLYGGDKDMRARQEIVLGIGGARALKALGIRPSIYHINEGHSWFLTLERIRTLTQEQNLSFKEALQFIWSTTIFTTHTPVPAGNEGFDAALLQRYLGTYIEQLGISWEEFLRIGRVFPDDSNEQFGMTVAALRTSAYANGVSQLHGKVSREMWQNIWPNLPREEVPIKAITNGVHVPTWVSHDMNELFESYLGQSYWQSDKPQEVWDKMSSIPDGELWRIHNRRRERLVFFSRKLLKSRLERRGQGASEIAKADQLLDPRVLTIGFARRFATYKRGNLLFSDPDRLHRILSHADKPVQILIAGKAHPLDTPGKDIIKQIYSFCQQDRFRMKIVFLEDYDINIARYLVQGCDVWLNNPRRPLEASGTSGMKAALNGALNFSVLDGWWVEGYDDMTGFRIGNGEEYGNLEVQDRFDGESLYDTLEKEIIPLFYQRNNLDIPEAWIGRMKAAISMAGIHFSSQNMLRNYAEQFYVSALTSAKLMQENQYAQTKELTNWLERMSESWRQLAITDIRFPEVDATLTVGQKIPVHIDVNLGEIRPEDVQVEIVAGKLDSQEQIRQPKPITTHLASYQNGHAPGTYTFETEVGCDESGRFGIAARIIPKNNLLPHPFRPKLISWWN